MTRTTSQTGKTAPKQTKKLSLSKQTLKDLTVRSSGPKGGVRISSAKVWCSF